MTSLTSVLKNGIYYLISQIIGPLIAFAVIPVYTRFFNSSEYGHFVIISTTINLLIMLGPTAVDNAIIRFYKRYQSDNKESDFISTAFFLLFLCIFVSASIACVVVINLNTIFRINEVCLIMIMLAVFTIDTIFRSILNLARTIEYARLYSSLNIIHLIVRTSLGVFFFLAINRAIALILTGWLTGGIIAVILIICKMKTHLKIRPVLFSKSIAKRVFVYGMPFLFIVVSVLAMDQIDRYMIMYFRGSAEVGIYNAGYLIASNSIYVLSSFIMMAAYPAVISAWEREGKSATNDLMNKLLRFFFILCVPAFTGVTMLSKEIVNIILPAEYLAGYTIVPYVALGAFFAGLLQYYTISMNLLEKSIHYALLYIIGLVINFILNLFLIPKFGYWGAGLSTALSYFIIFIILILLNTIIFKLHWIIPPKSFLTVCISTLIMGIFIHYFKTFFSGLVSLWSLILIIIAGIFIYFLFLVLFKEFNRNEISAVLGFILGSHSAAKR